MVILGYFYIHLIYNIWPSIHVLLLSVFIIEIIIFPVVYQIIDLRNFKEDCYFFRKHLLAVPSHEKCSVAYYENLSVTEIIRRIKRALFVLILRILILVFAVLFIWFKFHAFSALNIGVILMIVASIFIIVRIKGNLKIALVLSGLSFPLRFILGMLADPALGNFFSSFNYYYIIMTALLLFILFLMGTYINALERNYNFNLACLKNINFTKNYLDLFIKTIHDYSVIKTVNISQWDSIYYALLFAILIINVLLLINKSLIIILVINIFNIIMFFILHITRIDQTFKCRVIVTLISVLLSFANYFYVIFIGDSVPVLFFCYLTPIITLICLFARHYYDIRPERDKDIKEYNHIINCIDNKNKETDDIDFENSDQLNDDIKISDLDKKDFELIYKFGRIFLGKEKEEILDKIKREYNISEEN